MPGVTIADNCIIAAGSVVTHSFSENKVIAGNPAKAIKEINKEYIDKVSEKAFNMSGLSFEGRKSPILSDPSKLIKKMTGE